jgi:cytosine/adenosine deaminase-related metal-dependent hydrolase
MAPVTDPSAAVVLHAHPGTVDSVFVAGKAVKQGGKLLYTGLADLQQQAGLSRDYLLQSAGLRSAAALNL